MNHHADIELPPRIAALPRDKRGYPIPYVVFRDQEGQPVFVVNDSELVWKAAREALCGVCGEPLTAYPYPWFAGGPGAALLNGDHAAYMDGPMHEECCRFSLQVCPHLTHQLKKAVAMDPIQERLMAETGTVLADNTVIPGVPEVFMAVQAFHYEVKGRQRPGSADGPLYLVRKPFRKVQYWREGQMMDRREGERLAQRSARELAKTLPSRKR